jgi:hypothetical protein
MATTTNYGWTTPDNTAYVKDGASAIRTLGSAVDTTLYGLAGANTKVGMQLLSTTTLSGASTTISSISQNYADLEIWIYGMTNATASGNFRCAPNGSTTIAHSGGSYNSGGAIGNLGFNNDYIVSVNAVDRAVSNNAFKIKIENYASATNYKSLSVTFNYINSAGNSLSEIHGGGVKTNTAITSLVFSNSGGNWSTGTVKVWGCN